MRRYVPKTYYNRRFLRIIVRTVVIVSLAVLILIIVLFFGLNNYVRDDIDGTKKLDIPWLMSDSATPSE
jgi:hypothetical protein